MTKNISPLALIFFLFAWICPLAGYMQSTSPTTGLQIMVMTIKPGEAVGTARDIEISPFPAKQDLALFSKHTGMPNDFPADATDEAHANTTQVVKGKTGDASNAESNWTKSYTYDAAGRLTAYSFSGCGLCTEKPYDYKVHYNGKGFIDKIEDSVTVGKFYLVTSDAAGQVTTVSEYLGKNYVGMATSTPMSDIDSGF